MSQLRRFDCGITPPISFPERIEKRNHLHFNLCRIAVHGELLGQGKNPGYPISSD